MNTGRRGLHVELGGPSRGCLSLHRKHAARPLPNRRTCPVGRRAVSAVGTCSTDEPLAQRRSCSYPVLGQSWGHHSSTLRASRHSLQVAHARPASLVEPPPQVEPLSLWQKLVPLAVIFFCATFNHTLLVNLKDAIMVTAGGAETLPFLASCGVLPASLAFFVLYGRVLDLHLQRSWVFLLTVAPLVAFYVGFAVFLYPAADALHPHGLFASLAPAVPVGLHGLLKVVENWTFSLFFCVAEMWGAVVISVLFWTLANEVCTVAEAKAIYPLMGIAANVALVAAGNVMKAVNLALKGSELACLRVLVATVVALTGVIYGAEVYMERRVAVASHIDPGGGSRGVMTKVKRKGSLADAVQVLRESPMIFALALMVISYGVGHRLFEFSWKGMLRINHPSAMAYQGVLADVSIATGYATIALMIAGRLIFQRAGWAAAAFITPSVLLLFGGAFFAFSLSSAPGAAGWAVLAGAVTQVCARSSKFSLFDPAKEMAYIQMSRAEKSKGKAAVDLIGSQVGKSGASWITQALLLGCGSISAAMPATAAIFGAVVASFFLAVNGLRKEMVAHERHREEEAAATAKSSQQQAAEPATSSSPAQHHVTGSQPAHAAHTNGVYRLAESPVSEVVAAPEEAGHDLRNGSGGSANGVSHGGAPGQRAATPNVTAQCCSRGAAALQRRRGSRLSPARSAVRVGV